MRGVSDTIIDPSLSDREKFIRYRKGETLFREGELPRGIYILHSGIIELLFSAKNGQTKPLRGVRPGQILGLSCVVTNRLHDCTATAIEPCEVAFIERDDFLEILDESPAVWFNVLRMLSRDVNAVYNDMRIIAAR